MACNKHKNASNGNGKFHSEAIGSPDENSFGGTVELDSVDWGAVARCYKLLQLRSNSRKQIAQNEKLSADFERWVSMRSETVEFDIALRMLFDEIMAMPQDLIAVVNAPSMKPASSSRRRRATIG